MTTQPSDARIAHPYNTSTGSSPMNSDTPNPSNPAGAGDTSPETNADAAESANTTPESDDYVDASDWVWVKMAEMPLSVRRLTDAVQTMGGSGLAHYVEDPETLDEEVTIEFEVCPVCLDSPLRATHLGSFSGGFTEVSCRSCDAFSDNKVRDGLGLGPDDLVDIDLDNITEEWDDEPPVTEQADDEHTVPTIPVFDHPNPAVREKARDKWIRDEANALVDRERAAKTSSLIPTPVSLTDFLEIPDEEAEYRIEGLWPVGGRVMLAAQMKAGKTTMVNNLLRSLADGDPFLETFEVGKVNRITVIDDELDERMIRRWIRDQNIVNTGAIQLIPIRGNVSSFNILDPLIRAEWVKLVAGSDILVLDCLRPVIDALGLSEDKDSGRVLVAFDALLKEADIPEGAIVHHMGHNGERTRGDSRLRDWPDVSWKLVREDDSEDSPRFFSAYGRDVDVKEAQLHYDSTNRHLSFSGQGSRKDTKKAAKANDLTPHIVQIVTEAPGISTAELERQLKARGVRFQKGAIGFSGKYAESQGLITRTEGGPGKPTYHYPVVK